MPESIPRLTDGAYHLDISFPYRGRVEMVFPLADAFDFTGWTARMYLADTDPTGPQLATYTSAAGDLVLASGGAGNASITWNATPTLAAGSYQYDIWLYDSGAHAYNWFTGIATARRTARADST